MLDTTLDLSTFENTVTTPSDSFPLISKPVSDNKISSAPAKKPLSLQELLDQFEKDGTLDCSSKSPIDFTSSISPQTAVAKTTNAFSMKSKLSSIIVKCPIRIPRNEEQSPDHNRPITRKVSCNNIMTKDKPDGRSNSHIWNKYGEQGEVSIRMQTPHAQDISPLSARRPTKSHTTGTCTGKDTRSMKLPVLSLDNKIIMTKLSPNKASSQANLGENRDEKLDINVRKVFASQVTGSPVGRNLTFREKFFAQAVAMKKDAVTSSPRLALQPMSSRGPIQTTGFFKLKSSEEKFVPIRIAGVDTKKHFEAKGLKIEIKPSNQVLFRKKSHQQLGYAEKVIERS